METLLHNIDWRAASAFGLILARTSGALLAAPVFGAGQVPNLVKALLLVLVSAAFYGGARPSLGEPPAEVAGFVIVAVRELLIGLALGFAVRMVFTAVELAGQLIAAQLGLTFGSIVNPDTDQQSPALVNLMNAIAVLVFLALNGHHFVLQAVGESFRVSAPSLDGPLGEVAYGIALMGGRIFSLGVQIAAPILGVGLLSNVGLAIASRAAPALNVFSVSFAVPILVGLSVLAIAAPGIAESIAAAFRSMAGDLAGLFGRP
jgi:flagellar biosynthetic protein FliR